MKFKHVISLVLICSIILVGSCKKKKEPTPEPEPEPLPILKLSTSPITSVTDESAIGGGAIISEGTSAVVTQGICWDTLPEPSLTKGIVVKSTGTNNYTCAINNLKPYRKYYIRAYATNTSETAYGNELSFMSSDVWTKVPIAVATSTLIRSIGNKNNEIYVGTDNGLLYSPDVGDTWQATALTSTTNVIAVEVGENGIVFAETNGAIKKSSDKGKTWTTVMTIPNPNWVSDLMIDGSDVYAASSGSIFLSVNNGDTWTAMTNGLKSGQYEHIAKGAWGIFAINDGYTTVFKTNNKGTSWQQTSKAVNSSVGLGEIVCNGHNVLVSNNTGAYFSTDDGETWSKKTDLDPNYAWFGMSDSLLFYYSIVKNCKLSYNGGVNWTVLNNKGLPPTGPSPGDIFITDKAFFICYGGNYGLYQFRR